jgi:hypothetical protein
MATKKDHFPLPFIDVNVRTSREPFLLLFPWRLFQISPNPDPRRWLK